MKHDTVNHPPHYTAHPSGVECITVTEHMGFNLGNAVKYIWRADLKNDAVEDLKKARWYVDREIAKRTGAASATPSFQERVWPWMLACFNAEIANDIVERNDRFIEEAVELAQANGYSAERAHALVDYVFNRPAGEPDQEVGGVMVTLAALCLAAGLDMHDAGERELDRINQPEIMAKIRAKQAAKPTGSALPTAG